MADRVTKLVEIDESAEANKIIRTFVLFSQTTREVLKYVDAHLFREAGSSTIQWIVLQSLNHNNGRMTPSEISRWTQTERHNITTLIRRMEKAGLITSGRSRQNRRNVNVILTDKGREALEKIMPVAQKIVARVMSSISENDAAIMEKQLKIMRQNAHSGLEAISKRTPGV